MEHIVYLFWGCIGICSPQKSLLKSFGNTFLWVGMFFFRVGFSGCDCGWDHPWCRRSTLPERCSTATKSYCPVCVLLAVGPEICVLLGAAWYAFHLCHLSSERSEPLPRWFSEKSANVTLFIALPYWNVTADKASRMLESPLQRRRSGTASFPKLRPQGLPWRLWSGRCWCWVPQRPTTWSHRVRDRLVSGDVRLHLTSSVSISRLQFFNHENLKNIRIKKMWGEWNSSF